MSSVGNTCLLCLHEGMNCKVGVSSRSLEMELFMGPHINGRKSMGFTGVMKHPETSGAVPRKMTSTGASLFCLSGTS